MTDGKVKLHDVDLGTWTKVDGIPEEQLAIVASEHIADALHAKFEGIAIWATRDDGSLLFTERPGDWPE